MIDLETLRDETVDLVKRVARQSRPTSWRLERYWRAMDEVVPGESRQEREERLTAIHWALFDEAPRFNPSAPKPEQQNELPLGVEATHAE